MSVKPFPIVLQEFFAVNGAPTYIHGTQKRAKTELTAKLKNGKIAYPLVYLQEIQTDKILNDPMSAVYSKTPVRLWFLKPCISTWMTDQHYEGVVNDMAVLAHEFVRQAKYSNLVADYDEYDLVYHAQVGTTSDTGHLKDLLDEPHSGVLLVSTLSVNKSCCC